jgi:hypothetical protein
MIQVYRFIIQKMEKLTGPGQHSQTYTILNDASQEESILQWALNPGTQIVGRWFEDLQPPGVQKGGRAVAPLANNFLTSNTFTKNLATNMRKYNKFTQRNRKPKNILVNKVGSKSIKNRRTLKNRSKRNNQSQNMLRKQNRNQSGSSSTNISPFTADMYATIQSIRKNPQFSEIFQGIFVD